MSKVISLSILSLAATVAACGGDSSSADFPTFTYGATASPSASEGAAASSVNSTAAPAVVNFTASPTASNAQPLMGLSSSAMSAVSFSRPRVALQQIVFHALNPGSVQPAYDPACTKTTNGSVTLTNCSITSGGETTTMSGSLNVSGKNVTWSFNFSGSGTTTGSGHWTGNLTVLATSLSGTANIDATASTGGASVTENWQSDFNLTLSGSPACVASGTMETRVMFSNVQGAPAGSMPPSKGAKYTWTGCGKVAVAHSL